MPPEAAAAAAAATAAAAAEAAELLSSSGGERLQLLLGPRTTVGGGGERLSVEGGGTGGSGDGKGFGREKSSNADSNGLYGVLPPPPETRPPTAAAGVEAEAAEVMVLLAAVLAGHMMMIPLSSPMFVRLVRLLASARMVRVAVDDCSEGARVTMVMPAMWCFSSFLCESSNSPNYCCRMPYFRSTQCSLFSSCQMWQGRRDTRSFSCLSISVLCTSWRRQDQLSLSVDL